MFAAWQKHSKARAEECLRHGGSAANSCAASQIKLTNTSVMGEIMLKQVSIYMENSRGSMQKMLSLLSANDIGISSFVTNDSAEFGIVRMLLSAPERAMAVLREAGYLCRPSYITGVLIEDVTGELERLLRIINKMNINLEYIYSDFDRKTGKPVIVMQCESIDEVEEALVQNGYQIYEIKQEQ